MCHSVGKGRLIGPDLKGVNTKRNEEWIIKFVKGSQAFIKSGDADAKAIFDEYQVVMPDQNLTDAEIKSIITFIAANSEEKPAIAADEKAPIALTGAVGLVVTGDARVARFEPPFAVAPVRFHSVPQSGPNKAPPASVMTAPGRNNTVATA